MSDFFGGIFGKNDEVDTSSADATVDEDEKKAKAIRSALYETAGGSSGQELTAGQTQKRDTLFGN